MTRFGPAGNSDSFFEQGFRHTHQVPKYLAAMGLTAFEYQCGRGVRISDDKAGELGSLAAEQGIALSLHAPYYISLSSTEHEKRQGSIRYILQSARAVTAMGGQRIVVHSGSCSKITRSQALELACDTMRQALAALDAEGYDRVRVCPEVMGKVNQLGSLEEVLTLCALDERLIPCVDFGHFNARTFGGLKTMEDYKAIFEAIQNRLGLSRLRELHCHFSKIEYTDKGGEKRHLTLKDTTFGPDYEPLVELLVRYGCDHAVIICESDGTQAEDAATMMRYYRSLLAQPPQE